MNQSLTIEDSLTFIQNILPDVPSYVDQNKNEVTFMYQSSFVNSFLIVTLKNPSAGMNGHAANDE